MRIADSLVAVDDCLFDHLFQPMVNRCHGLSTVDIARCVLAGYTLIVIWQINQLYLLGQLGVPDIVATALLLALLCGTYVLLGMSHSGGPNVNRVLWRTRAVRLSCLFLLASDILSFVMAFSRPGHWVSAGVSMIREAVFTTYLYVSACDDPPPPKARPAWGDRIEATA